MALWELEAFQGPQFLGFVRNIPNPDPFIANRWLPDRTVFDLEVEYLVGATNNPVMASIMAWDSEAPIAGTPGLGTKQTMELPPIKRKARIPEKQLIRFLSPRAGSPDVQDAIDSVYDHATRLVQGVQARVEWMRMQALSEDTLAYSEEGVTITLDYGITAAQQLDAVADLPGANYWTNTTLSKPIDDLQFVCDLVEAAQGFRPNELVIARSMLSNLLKNDSVRALALGSGFTRQLTLGELNSTLDLYDLPNIVTYDVKVYQEEANGTVSTLTPLNPANGVLLFSPGSGVTIGETLWGPTAESRPLIGTNRSFQAPGIYSTTYGKEDPPSEWVKVAAVAAPTLPGANLISQLRLAA